MAAFTTRIGGVSEPPYESLNLAVLTGDEAVAVRENRHRLAGAVGLDPARVVIGRQVHGAEIAAHEVPQSPSPFAEPGPEPPHVDGHRTESSGLGVLVFVADCLPIALSGGGGIAILHCGWRGMAAGIIDRGVREVGARAAAVGPGIGPCCYEVGEDVLAQFLPLGEVANGRMLNLRAVAISLLERAGVERIEASDLCTSCASDLFFSHRRDGERTGRQAGLVWRSESG